MRQDTQDALTRFGMNPGKSDLRKITELETRIASDEQILFIYPSSNVVVLANGSGKHESYPACAVALTSKRMVLTYRLLFEQKEITTPVSELRSVTTTGGLILGGIELQTVISTIKLTTIEKRILPDIQALFYRLIEQNSQASTPTIAPVQGTESTTDITSKLRELSLLHEEGVLTDEEYAAAKRQALGL